MRTAVLIGLLLIATGGMVVGHAEEPPLQARAGEEALTLLAPALADRTDLDRFLDQEPLIERLYVTDTVDYEETSTLTRGGDYLFWVWFAEGVCRPFEVREAFFRASGKRVYHVVREFSGDTCNTVGVGIPLTVPPNAPLETYTWGARVTNGYGSDTYYPASFTIVR